MTKEPYSLSFRGGAFASAVPMLFFIVWAIVICLSGAPDVKGLILGLIIGLSLTLFLIRGRWWDYCEEIFTGMANRIGVVTIVCWLWAGMFAQVLRAGGLVDGLVWLGIQSGVGSGMFTALTFLLAALFASAVGTGYGTTVAFCTLMFPAGIALGAEPVILFGSILSGAAFGDNLAPVSDTTIVSATTQETDIPGVVRSRFKYAITAAIPALILFVILGSTDSPSGIELNLSTDLVKPGGLFLLIPFALVIVLAMSGRHIITALTFGIILAVVMIPLLGLAPVSSVMAIDREAGLLTGALTDGIGGYVEMAVLVLLIMSANHIMRIGGAFDVLRDTALRLARDSVRRAELVICTFVASLNVFITVNTAAEIAAAPLVSDIGKHFKLHPYRRANFLDSISSALGYIFPWGGGVLIGYVTLTTLKNTDFPNLPVPSPTEVWPFVFHGWFLVVVMYTAAITGFGRKMKTSKKG
jgi:Na+/H+ antiporter NhaC